MADQTAGEGVAATPTERDATSEAQAPKDDTSGLKSALDKERKDRRDALSRAKEAQQQAAEAEAKLAQVLKAAGHEGETDNVESVIAKERARAERAENAFAMAEFQRAALEAGIRPDRVAQARKLADLSSVVVDLEAGTADGVDDAARTVLDSMPEFGKQTNMKPVPPATENRPAGKPHGATIDVGNIQPGDISKMSDTDFDALLSEGVYINTGRNDANGTPIRFFFRSGGDQSSHDIRAAREAYKRQQKDGAF